MTWRRLWLRISGCLFVFHVAMVGVLIAEYSEVALMHEDARVVLERLNVEFGRDDVACAAEQKPCPRPADDDMSFSAVLAEISQEWDEAEQATVTAIAFAAISWLLISCAVYALGGGAARLTD